MNHLNSGCTTALNDGRVDVMPPTRPFSTCFWNRSRSYSVWKRLVSPVLAPEVDSAVMMSLT